jgi:hypothetical protein
MTCHHTARLTFAKATASGGNNTGPNCVEVANFFKADASNPSGNCVEVTYATALASNGNGGANCVEVGPARKATASIQQYLCVTVAHAAAAESAAAGHCVEPGQAQPEHTGCTPETCKTPGIEPGDVVVRDSKHGGGDDSPLLVFKPEQWDRYVDRVILGEYELTGGEYPYVMRDPNGGPVTLHFNQGEWDAFRDGCTKGEFTYPAPVTV